MGIDPILWPILLVALALFAGLRGAGIDRDYDNYASWFDSLRNGADWLDYIKDPAFVLLARATIVTGLPPSVLFLIFAVCAVASKYVFAKAAAPSTTWRWLFLLIICRFFVVHDMTQIRAAVAIPLASLAIIKIREDHTKSAILLVIVATIFHISAGLYAPLLLLVKWRRWILGPRRLWVMVLCGLLAFALQGVIMGLLSVVAPERLAPYFDGSYGTVAVSFLNINFLSKLAVFLYLTGFAWQRLSEWNRVVLLMVTIGITIQITFLWNDAIALRGAELFGLFDMVMYMIPITLLARSEKYLYAMAIAMMMGIFYFSSLRLVGPYF